MPMKQMQIISRSHRPYGKSQVDIHKAAKLQVLSLHFTLKLFMISCHQK